MKRKRHKPKTSDEPELLRLTIDIVFKMVFADPKMAPALRHPDLRDFALRPISDQAVI